MAGWQWIFRGVDKWRGEVGVGAKMVVFGCFSAVFLIEVPL
jgi:hypothetical protein